MIHYVYKLEDDHGNFYYGSRSSLVCPTQDKYMGSGVWAVNCAQNGVKLKKTIVESGFTHRKDACKKERELIVQTIDNPQSMNRTLSTPVPNSHWLNPFAPILKVRDLHYDSVILLVYVYLAAMDNGKGISELVLSLQNQISIQQCQKALHALMESDLTPLPNVEKNGNIWSIKK